MAWVDAYRQIKSIVQAVVPSSNAGMGQRFALDESEPSELDDARQASRTVRVTPTAFGTNSADQTPGNRRTFVDVSVEVYYRPQPRNRSALIEAMGTDYENLRDAFMNTVLWGRTQSGIIALGIGAVETKPADVTYSDAGVVLAFALSLEYEDI